MPNTESVSTDLDPLRWLSLVLICVAQLLIVIDGSIVNVAIPSIMNELDVSSLNGHWTVTAYALAFGGFLLIGGRLADYLGRKRMFIISLIGFALSTIFGGLALNAAMFFGARALQGLFAAVMAPAALSLLAVTFTVPSERIKAFGAYGAVAGGGQVLGLLMGGIIMSNASWRWCLLVIAPIAIIAAWIALRGIRESKSERKGSYDIPGAVTVTLGLVILVYGLSQAEINGWGSPFILACIGISIVLLIAFVLIERRSSHPLLPLRVVMDRNRAAALVTSLLMGASIYGLFLFLTYYLQGSLNYSPLMTGLAFVPLSAMIFLSASFSGRLLRFVSTRLAMSIGLLLAALGILWLTRISVDTGYPMLLVAELVIGLGLGFVFVTINSIGLFGVKPGDAGAASALMNATQQIGGAIGLAVLNTVAVVATNSYLSQESRVSDHSAAASIYGYSVSFGVITLFVVIALVVIILGVRMNEQTASTES